MTGFDGGPRRAGHGGAAAALAGGACSRMNPARSPVERGPSVRAHGASRRVEGRRPPRHEERRRLGRRRPNKGASIRAATAAAPLCSARHPKDGGVAVSSPSCNGGRSAGPKGNRRVRGALGEDSPHSFQIRVHQCLIGLKTALIKELGFYRNWGFF